MVSRFLIAAIAMMLATPSLANDKIPPNDEIVPRLRAEDWVQTATAKVTAIVETVQTGDQAGQQSGRVPPALAELAPGVDWRVVGFDRTQDASGLERWRLTAEARLAEGALGGIYDRARKISKPGQQVTVANVEFEPTMAERETTAAKLRAEIYKRAAEEAERTKQVWPDRGFRVQRIDFAFNGIPPRPMAMKAARGAEMSSFEAQPDAGVDVSERMVLNATVILAAAPPEKAPTK